MASENVRECAWVPIGRSGWHYQMRQRILNLIQQDDLKRKILDAGFAHGQPNLFEAIIGNFLRVIGRLGWI